MRSSLDTFQCTVRELVFDDQPLLNSSDVNSNSSGAGAAASRNPPASRVDIMSWIRRVLGPE